MKIFNVMFSTVNGGVEQVFLNYTKTLEQQGNQVVSVIHPWAAIRKECSKNALKTIYSFGRNDFIAVRRLHRLIEAEEPACIVTHTKRAALLFKQIKTKIPKIAVCHTRQSFSELEQASDAVIAITDHMHQDIIKSGGASKMVFTIPNMVHIPEGLTYTEPKERDVPVIGVSARFSDLKGIDVFIEALAELKRRNIPFKAKIAGDGKQRRQYIKLIQHYALDNQVVLLGWVHDKDAFYNSLSVFCHPSLKESFGLVVVESMMHSLPMVLTELSGPSEIIGGTDSAIMVPPSDPMRLANGLECILVDKSRAKQMAFNAFQRVQYYSSWNIGPMLHRVLEDCVACHKK